MTYYAQVDYVLQEYLNQMQDIKQEHQFRKLRAKIKLYSNAISTQLKMLRKGVRSLFSVTVSK